MAKNTAPATPAAAETHKTIVDETISYEEAFQQLEAVLGRLEEGDLPLEESLMLYEQGAALIKQCETKLAEAELKITTLSRDA